MFDVFIVSARSTDLPSTLGIPKALVLLRACGGAARNDRYKKVVNASELPLIMITRKTGVGVALLALVVSSIGCGKGTTSDISSAPTSPSAVTPGAPSATGSATINGTLAGATSAGQFSAQAVMTITITVTGTGISATASPGGTFVLNGVPAGNVELRFTGPGVDARSNVADIAEGEQIRIVVTVQGSNAAVNVTDRKKPENGKEIEGLITEINLAARTIVVNGTTISVPTDSIIRHGNTTLALSQLKNGQRVHVKGTVSGSMVVASEVKLQDENENDDDREEAEVEGTVSAKTGTCPALTFMVKTTKVTTDGSTQFKGGACAAIANGKKVEVEGTRQADASIKAKTVELDSDKD